MRGTTKRFYRLSHLLCPLHLWCRVFDRCPLAETRTLFPSVLKTYSLVSQTEFPSFTQLRGKSFFAPFTMYTAYSQDRRTVPLGIPISYNGFARQALTSGHQIASLQKNCHLIAIFYHCPARSNYHKIPIWPSSITTTFSVIKPSPPVSSPALRHVISTFVSPSCY